jgi:plasmid stability protein
MSVMIQIRNVPDDVHRTLKSRAALAGMSLSEYLLREIREVAERPTFEEALTRIRSREPVITSVDVVDVLRAARDGQ